MPRKAVIRKEDIIKAAVELVREKGHEALNARALAECLENKLIFKLFNVNSRSVRTIKHFEAVFEEGLALVVSNLQSVNRGLSTTAGSTCPRNTHGNVVDSTCTEGEGACRLHETTVSRSVAHGSFCPTISRVVIGGSIRNDTHRTPVTGVGKAGEHEVAIRTGSTIQRVCVGTVFHLQVICPDTTKHVIVSVCHFRVTHH